MRKRICPCGAGAVERKLNDAPAGDDQVASTINGPLLLRASADAEDEPGGRLIRQLVSSFAGEE